MVLLLLQQNIIIFLYDWTSSSTIIFNLIVVFLLLFIIITHSHLGWQTISSCKALYSISGRVHRFLCTFVLHFFLFTIKIQHEQLLTEQHDRLTILWLEIVKPAVRKWSFLIFKMLFGWYYQLLSILFGHSKTIKIYEQAIEMKNFHSNKFLRRIRTIKTNYQSSRNYLNYFAWKLTYLRLQ